MKPTLLLLGLLGSALPAVAVVPAADAKTVEGWQAFGFPIDDYVPWNLGIQAKELGAKNGQYVVVAGYLVASAKSVTLFPDKEAALSGRREGTLSLAREDSPALRWLFGDERAEGFFAVGGVLSVTPKGPQLGQLTKIRFAMRKEPNGQTTPAAANGGGAH